MDWQQVVSLVIVAAAAGLLLRHYRRGRGRPVDCEGCGHGNDHQNARPMHDIPGA